MILAASTPSDRRILRFNLQHCDELCNLRKNSAVSKQCQPPLQKLPLMLNLPSADLHGWPEDILYYAIPIPLISSRTLAESPDPVTGQIIRDPANTILHLRKLTEIPAFGYGTGRRTLERVENVEYVVWLSGYHMDSTPEQRAHAAHLLGVDPSAIVQMYNH
ncbi:hypothetical protein BS47DRAFT_1336988 [Hydnum rufescens UP504]|uniref:Uncharacterized protein n=1 Tax=Hydnum rufescens UP504 TaxID=1448309 RepID=A0A9P6B892_9AGAM|nr:hypothetical protein BS47DRAFT_1336988 [Hydnum rufescens UP504]